MLRRVERYVICHVRCQQSRSSLLLSEWFVWDERSLTLRLSRRLHNTPDSVNSERFRTRQRVLLILHFTNVARQKQQHGSILEYQWKRIINSWHSDETVCRIWSLRHVTIGLMWPSFVCASWHRVKKLPNNWMMKIKLNDMIVGFFVFGDLFQAQKRNELPIFFFSARLSIKSHTINPHLIFTLIVVRSFVLHCFNDLQWSSDHLWFFSPFSNI